MPLVSDALLVGDEVLEGPDDALLDVLGVLPKVNAEEGVDRDTLPTGREGHD